MLENIIPSILISYNKEYAQIIYGLLLDLFTFLYVSVKFYRVLCYTQITFDQLPLFNPYLWPVAPIRILTNPYFRFWRKILPPVRIGKVGFEISSIMAFEALASILYYLSYFKLLLEIEFDKVLS